MSAESGPLLVPHRLLLALLLGAALAYPADFKSLQPQGYVSDFAHAIDAGSRQQLEQYCYRVEQATGVQMALVTVDTLDNEPIENVTIDLFRRWGIGKKNEDNGLLLLLAIRDRKQRVEVGRKLEPILPDGFDGGVLREMRPALKEGAYGQALLLGAQQMGSRVAQAKGVALDAEEVPRPQRREQPSSSILWPLLLVGLFFLLWLMSRGGGRGGGGFLSGMLLGNLMGGGFGRRGGFGGGGFGGYDSGGGGGGGGFGGFGGGDSGGGGASSDW